MKRLIDVKSQSAFSLSNHNISRVGSTINMVYPRMKYHKIKGDFTCPSEEFFNTLSDKDEWEDEPFNGPRKALLKENKACQECNKLKIDIKNLEIHNNELEILIIDYKMEVDRLRIALKMSDSKEAIGKRKLSPEHLAKLSAGRLKAKALKDKV